MFELRLLCPEERVEAVSDALEALDALSVSVEDADAQTPAEQALFGEPGMPPPKEGWQRSLVIALFAGEPQAQEAAGLLQPQDFFHLVYRALDRLNQLAIPVLLGHDHRGSFAPLPRPHLDADYGKSLDEGKSTGERLDCVIPLHDSPDPGEEVSRVFQHWLDLGSPGCRFAIDRQSDYA